MYQRQINAELRRIKEIRLAIAQELNFIESEKNQTVQLSNGKFIKKTRKCHAYLFEMPPNTILKDVDNVRLWVNDISYECTWSRYRKTISKMLNFDPHASGSKTADPKPKLANMIVLYCSSLLPEDLEQVTLESDKGKFLREIKRHYDDLALTFTAQDYKPSYTRQRNMAEQLFSKESKPLLSILSDRVSETHVKPLIRFSKDDSAIASLYMGLNTHQKRAVVQSQERTVSVIWGPPGTGKTHTLALAAIKHMQAGRRVLLISNANEAVDVCMAKICEMLKDTGFYKNYKLLRLSHNPSQLEKTYPKLALRNHCRPEAGSNKGWRTVREQRSHDDVFNNARLIGATSHKAVTESSLHRCGYDVLIVDEASFVSLPTLYAVARHAKQAIVLVGDFLQLPPIGSCQDQPAAKWFQRSIFDELDIASVSKALSANYVCALKTQYRMHPHIASITNSVFYDDMLISDPSTQGQIYSPPSALLDPNPITIVDTSSILNKHDYSPKRRCNKHSASLCLDLLSAMLKDGHFNHLSIGYTAPFRRQVSYLQRLWDETFDDRHMFDASEREQLRINTVHSFQGDQVDCLILDLTECSTTPDISYKDPTRPGWRPDLLINVAISRARKKLIIVGNLPYFKSQYPHTDFINKVLFSAISKGTVIDANTISSDATMSSYEVMQRQFLRY